MIIVTGASGLVGSHLLEQLSQQFPDRKIVALYSRNLPSMPYPHVEYRRCDLKNWEDTLDCIAPGAEVYHCAAIVAFDKKSHKTLIEDNVLMTENVINACLLKDIKKLVHVSSIAALSREKNDSGQAGDINESAQWTNSDSNSLYAKSKYFSELEVWRGIEEGLNAIIINPGIILGESSDWERGSSALIHKVAKGLKFYTNGVNGYVDVKDVVRIMILLMSGDIKSERFVVVENNYSYQKLFSKIARGLGTKEPTIEARPWMSKLLVLAESFKSLFSDKAQLITSETARTAFQKNLYNNKKLLEYLPAFRYTPFDETIVRITKSYKNSKI